MINLSREFRRPRYVKSETAEYLKQVQKLLQEETEDRKMILRNVFNEIAGKEAALCCDKKLRA